MKKLLLLLLVVGGVSARVDQVRFAKEKQKRSWAAAHAYPLSEDGRKYKKECLKLRRAKGIYKDQKRVLASNDRLLKQKEKKCAFLEKRLIRKHVPEYRRGRATLDSELRTGLAGKGVDKGAVQRAYDKQRRALDIKHDLVPLQNRLDAVDTQLGSLQRHHAQLKDEHEQLSHRIENLKQVCGELYDRVPKLPLTRYDISECKRKAVV